MIYHIARIIPQKKIEDKTLLYFANGTIGYISSKVNIKDFCVVSFDLYEYPKYQYVDNLENIEVIKRPNNTKWDKDFHIDEKVDFAIIMLESIRRDGFQPNGIFSNGIFYSKRDGDYVESEDFCNYLLSDSDLAVVEEQYFSQLISYSYREISPELLIKLYNTAEVKLSGLIIEDIINSFTITGRLQKNCKSGKDNDWTIDWAHMDSHIKYSDSYIEHILPSQKYQKHTDACGFGIPSFFYRNDLESLLNEKAETMKSNAMAMYSKKEHIMYIFHKYLSDILRDNTKYLEYKKRVHNNYIEFWNNRKEYKYPDNKASIEWLDATKYVDSKIIDTNLNEMIIEYNKRVRNFIN